MIEQRRDRTEIEPLTIQSRTSRKFIALSKDFKKSAASERSHLTMAWHGERSKPQLQPCSLGVYPKKNFYSSWNRYTIKLLLDNITSCDSNSNPHHNFGVEIDLSLVESFIFKEEFANHAGNKLRRFLQNHFHSSRTANNVISNINSCDYRLFFNCFRIRFAYEPVRRKMSLKTPGERESLEIDSRFPVSRFE